VDLFGAVCPSRDTGVAVIMPHANTEAMQAHLDEISLPALWSGHEASAHHPVVWARTARAAGVLLLDVRVCGNETAGTGHIRLSPTSLPLWLLLAPPFPSVLGRPAARRQRIITEKNTYRD
jgi:hypothetical protein